MIVKYYFKVMGDGDVHEFHSEGKTPAEAEFDYYRETPKGEWV